MIPKAAACLAAIDGGVGRARIIDGREPHPLTRAGADSSGTVIMSSASTPHQPSTNQPSTDRSTPA